MSDYTPTTEEVREDYKLLAGDGEDRAVAHAEFDRWLAAHDAEVRASVLGEQGEPEWEYRWAREDGEHAWPFGAGDSEDGESLDVVRDAPGEDPDPGYFNGMHIERRKKAAPAGPWLPFEENKPESTVVEIRREAEAVALRVYPEQYHVHMRRAYADAYERGARSRTDRTNRSEETR